MHAQREAVSAASTCPVPRMGNASPSSLGNAGKCCQQQPRQRGTCSYTSRQPEPGPGAPSCYFALLAARLTLPIPSIFSQILLFGAPSSPGSSGSSTSRHQLHHVHGACGGHCVLPHHGVSSVQTHLVPPGLHPGRSPPLTLQAHLVLSSTRHCSHSHCFFFIFCSKWPGVLVFCVSSAPAVGILRISQQKWPCWGSESQSGWCPSAHFC